MLKKILCYTFKDFNTFNHKLSKLAKTKFSCEICNELEQQGNLLRMRQISIETWRFPRRNNEMFVVVW